MSSLLQKLESLMIQNTPEARKAAHLIVTCEYAKMNPIDLTDADSELEEMLDRDSSRC